MRILFALTVVLGVSTPTLTTTTANSVGTRVDDGAPDLHAAEPQQVSKPLGDIAIEGNDQHLISSETRDETEEMPVAVKVEEPVVIKADERAEESLPVTVPIERICEALADAAIAQGLPIGFFARLIWQESRFDQWARSHAGARGVAQFMPPTAAEHGLQDPFDPIESVAASARFLRQLREQFGNLGLAAAAYNAGGGRIKRWLNGQSGLPEETRNYVHVITGHPPKRWTVQEPLEISFALPHRAPCDGVEGLSRDATSAQHEVRLTGLAVELIEQAAAARAKIAAARNKRHAAARATKGRKLAATRVAATELAKQRVASASEQ